MNVSVKPNELRSAEGYTIEYSKAQGKTDTTYVGTGDTLKLYKTSDPTNYKIYTVIVTGDANGDGRITAKDYKAVKKHVMGTSSLTGVYKEAVDINKDNGITANDYKRIKRYVMKGVF